MASVVPSAKVRGNHFMSGLSFSPAAAAILAALLLSGCSSSLSTILADDDALCRYSADANAANSISKCRTRVAQQRVTLVALSADQIDGYVLLNGPAPASDVAGRCKGSNPPEECADVTGTIPAKPSPSLEDRE